MSLFTNIYGSRIIVFTEGNCKGENQFSQRIFETMEEYEEDLTMSTDVPYSIVVDKQTGEIELDNQWKAEYYSSTSIQLVVDPRACTGGVQQSITPP